MSVEELVKRLRGVDHMSVEDCFLQSHLFGHAADKLEELAAENEQLRKALEQIEQQLDYGQLDTALRIARRALEGGNDAEQAETATDAEAVAWLIHAPEDDYYGIGPVTLQFNPLEQWDLDKGYTQTPLYTRPPE